jgi:hypothetical protein
MSSLIAATRISIGAPMRNVARGMTPGEIEQTALYYADAP